MYAFSCLLVGGLVVDFGFNLSSLDAVGKSESRSEKQRIIRDTLGAKMLLWIAVSLFFCALGATRTLPHLDFLVFWFPLLLLANVFFSPWLLQGLGMARELTVINVGSRLICLILVLLLIQSPHDATAALLLQQAPVLLSAPAAWLVVRKHGLRLEVAVRHQHFATLRASAPLFVSALASGALNYANSIALGSFSSRVAVGQYNAGTRVASSALTALTPLQAVVLPMLSRSAKDPRNLSRQARQAAPVFLCVYAVAGACLALFATPIAEIYLRDGNATTIGVLRWLGVGVAATGIEVWAYSALIAAGAARRATYTYLTIAVIHVACAFLLASSEAAPVNMAKLWAASSILVAVALSIHVVHVLGARVKNEN